MSQFSTARTSVSFTFDGCFFTAGKIANWLLDFCQLTVSNLDMTARLHMAAHELIENVVKYGSTPDIGLEFEFVRALDGTTVRLSTRNQATPQQLAEVVRRVGELREAPDPIAYYDQLIRRTATLAGQSGLGLARIRAEAGLDVDCAVEGPETISIMVQTTMQAEQ